MRQTRRGPEIWFSATLRWELSARSFGPLTQLDGLTLLPADVSRGSRPEPVDQAFARGRMTGIRDPDQGI